MDLLDYVVKSMDNGNENNDQLNSFKSFLEAIVAYMKYFGDKNQEVFDLKLYGKVFIDGKILLKLDLLQEEIKVLLKLVVQTIM